MNVNINSIWFETSRPKLPYEEVDLMFNGKEWIEDHGLKFNLVHPTTIGTPNEIRQEIGLPPVGTKGEDA